MFWFLVLSQVALSHVFGNAAEHEAIVDGRDLEVVDGKHECASHNCSYEYSASDIIQCSVEECNALNRSISSPEKPDITELYFVIYEDKRTGRKELALEVVWSPSDDSTISLTTGYKIHIRDGFSSYEKCYYLHSPLDFEKLKVTFFNDCYGKVNGTKIILGSSIRVSVTSLPLWSGDITDSEVMNDIQVPDCTYEKFSELAECVEEKNRGKNCSYNCSASSSGSTDSITYSLSCSVPQIFRKGECHQRNRSPHVSIPAPHLLRAEWYKYVDDKENEIKLALNISWSAKHDGSISRLDGYHIAVGRTSASPDFNTCYYIQSDLEVNKHAQIDFYYECYGKENSTNLEVNQKYTVYVENIPSHDGGKVQATVRIPGCADPQMQDLTFCKNRRKERLKGDVDEIYCANKSIRYTYHVSPKYGDSATIHLCKKGSSIMDKCSQLFGAFEGLSPSNTLYNISLKSLNHSFNYMVSLRGNREKRHVHDSDINFSKCYVHEESLGQNIIVAFVIGLGILLAILIAILCYCNLRQNNRNCPFVNHSKKDSCKPSDPDEECQENTEQTEDCPQPAATQPTKTARVYVIFIKDHEFHTEVVRNFCNYLKSDLGIDVHIHFWETLISAANPIDYMMRNLKDADKVVIICSEGTRNCLEKGCAGDQFTPVVRSVINETFVGKNPGKFLVGYFEYSSAEDVPELLREQTTIYCSQFKLMKQFEDFYFRLMGIEKYQDVGILRIEKIAFDRYYDPKLTKCGLKLKESIDRMREFVTRNPTWFTDSQGTDMAVVDLPPEMTPAPSSNGRVDYPDIDQRSIRLVPPSFPQPISDDQVNLMTRVTSISITDPVPVTGPAETWEGESFVMSQSELDDSRAISDSSSQEPRSLNQHEISEPFDSVSEPPHVYQVSPFSLMNESSSRQIDDCRNPLLPKPTKNYQIHAQEGLPETTEMLRLQTSNIFREEQHEEEDETILFSNIDDDSDLEEISETYID